MQKQALDTVKLSGLFFDWGYKYFQDEGTYQLDCKNKPCAITLTNKTNGGLVRLFENGTIVDTATGESFRVEDGLIKVLFMYYFGHDTFTERFQQNKIAYKSISEFLKCEDANHDTFLGSGINCSSILNRGLEFIYSISEEASIAIPEKNNKRTNKDQQRKENTKISNYTALTQKAITFGNRVLALARENDHWYNSISEKAISDIIQTHLPFISIDMTTTAGAQHSYQLANRMINELLNNNTTKWLFEKIRAEGLIQCEDIVSKGPCGTKGMGAFFTYKATECNIIGVGIGDSTIITTHGCPSNSGPSFIFPPMGGGLGLHF